MTNLCTLSRRARHGAIAQRGVRRDCPARARRRGVARARRRGRGRGLVWRAGARRLGRRARRARGNRAHREINILRLRGARAGGRASSLGRRRLRRLTRGAFRWRIRLRAFLELLGTSGPRSGRARETPSGDVSSTCEASAADDSRGLINRTR